jgi:hypothetical protein
MLFFLLGHDANTVDATIVANRSAFQDGIIVNTFSIFIIRF